MTFEIHDTFKVGDEVKILHKNKVGIVTSIHENFSEYPYTVKYSSYSEQCSAKALILIKEAPQNKSFNLYDKVEIVDKKHKFYGAKGIIGYLDGTIDCLESKCRIQTECKTRAWYAMESQIKLVSSNEREEVTNCAQEVRVATNEVYNNIGSILSNCKANKTEPSHYKNQSIETIDMMVRIWGAKAVVLFCEINAFKYRMRVGSKEGESIEDDIKKAQWYEQRANELRAEK